MRVCVVTPSYAPDLGGMAGLVEHTALALDERGVEVVVATQRSTTESMVAAEANPRVVVHGFTNRLGGRRFGYAPALTSWVRAHQDDFDLLHAFGYHAPVALSTALATSTPLVFTPTLHGGGHSTLARAAHVVYRPLARQIFRRARAIVCLSLAEEATVLAMFPSCAGRTRVVPAGFGPLGDEGTIEPYVTDRPVILSAGRLDEYKGNDRLISALEHLRVPARLVLCGEGSDRDRLVDLARSLGVGDRVEFRGHVSDEELDRWRVTASVAVSLSSHESFGLSLAESASAGANIVASDIAVHREVVARLGVAASFVDNGDDAATIAATITDELARPRRHDAMARRSWDDVASDLIDIYSQALAGSGRP